MRRWRCTALWLVSGAVSLGAGSGIWQTKEFKDWTDKDAQSIMRDSPWAKQMPMPAGGRPGVMVIEPGSNGAPPPSATLGNPATTTTGTNMTNSSYPGSMGPADPGGTHTLPTASSPSGVAPNPGAPEPQPLLTVVWASAAPVRLAVLKLRSAGQPITDEEIAKAKSPRENYTIAVAGLPAPDRDYDPKELAKRASLNVKGKPPLAASETIYRKIGNSDVYFFRFSRTALPITTDDQQIEFKMRMGKMELKHKFELREMQFQGQLAL